MSIDILAIWSVDGKCYELLDTAHKQYVNLAASRDIETLRLQLSKVEPKDAMIPIIFSGKDSDIEQFKRRYPLTMTSQHKVKYFPNIDASAVTANISKSELQNLVDNLTLKDVYPLSKTVEGSIGIEPNKNITSAEGKDISIKSKAFMSNGVREIISNSEDLKVERWRELCLYHKRDFETMFTADESNILMEYHKDKVILMN